MRIKIAALATSLFVASVTAAAAEQHFGVGNDASGFTRMNGSEAMGTSYGASNFRFKELSSPSGVVQLGATGTTHFDLGMSNGTVSFNLGQRIDNWISSAGTKTNAQMSSIISNVRNSAATTGAVVTPLPRPTGWLKSGLPNTIGYSIDPDGIGRGAAPTVYSLNRTDRWSRSFTDRPYDYQNDGGNGGGGN